MALTEIGEIGIYAGDRLVTLRPSLAAMARLGDGAAIVAAFDELHRLKVLPTAPAAWINRALHRRFLTAVEVLQACTDEDISDLTGYQGQSLRSWVPGPIQPSIAVHLARSLMAHGLLGVVPDDDRYEPDPSAPTHTAEFRPADIAAMAMAHLGYTEREAWNLTVTAFTLAMRAKFPPPARKTPTVKEHDATMAWLAEVNKGR